MPSQHVDVVIVGAGLSGVGAACRLMTGCPGKTFTVRVTVRDPKHKDLAGKLTDMVEAEIIRNDRRLSAEKAGGENVISCSNETNLREKAHADLVRRGLLPVSPDDVNIHD